MFINICSLTKTKNKVRAVVALEADMWQNDIAVCVVMEKHLKPAQPDAKVNIANCSIFNVYRSTLYEVICINLRLLTGHQFLMCGMYHLPKRKYAEVDSMSHITNIVDNKLDEHPQTVVVCGGDLNKLNIDRLEELTGWNRRCWVFWQEASHA